MKKLILLIAVVLLYSCDDYGPDNKYIGHIPGIQNAEGEAYVKWKSHAKEGAFDNKKYKDQVSKEEAKLEGVKMPCVSGHPEVFSVVGDVAEFKDGWYHVQLIFNKAISIKSSSTLNVCFFNMDEQQMLGAETQMYSIGIGISNYWKGDYTRWRFSLNSIRYNDYVELQQKANIAVLYFGKDSFSPNRVRRYGESSSNKNIQSYQFDEAVRQKIDSFKAAVTPVADPPKKSANVVNGYEFVDLGLSVKWAVCNVGAELPEEYGDTFAWGETEPKDKTYEGVMWSEEKCWENYKLVSHIHKEFPYKIHFSKYNESDRKTVLESDDDAATIAMGAPWRVPTREEWQELLNKCSRKDSRGSDISFVAPNGNSISFPIIGFRCSYLTSSLEGSSYPDVLNANYAAVQDDGINIYSQSRYNLCLVRAVLDK